MDRNVQISILVLTLFMIFMIPGPISKLISAQLPDINNNMNMGSLGSSPLPEENSSSSLSNIQTISMVDGIEISRAIIGENEATVILKYLGGKDNNFDRSIPVTVIVVKTPNGKNNTNPLADIMAQMGGMSAALAGSNMSSKGGVSALSVSEPIKPLQALLQLGKDTQIGVGNIVGGNWEKPRSITTGISTLGGLLGLEGSVTSEPQGNLAMVLVVPYTGKTSFGSIDFQ